MFIIELVKLIDELIKNPSKARIFFRENFIALLLTILVFILLYTHIAESARRKALNGQLKTRNKEVKKLKTEVINTKRDFYRLQKQINENDSIFVNSNRDKFLSVDTLLRRMSERFEADGISVTDDDRQR